MKKNTTQLKRNKINKFNKGLRVPSLVALAVAQALAIQSAEADTIQTGPRCNLAHAIISANNDSAPSNSSCADGSGADVIEMTNDVQLTDPDNGVNGLPIITSAVTINGNGLNIRRLASAPQFRILEINTTENVTLNDVGIRLGKVDDNRGAGINIEQANELTLNNVRVTDNISLGGNGGGIALNDVNTTNINSSIVSRNRANRNGGGVFRGFLSDDIQNSPSVNISDSTIEQNTSGDGGGVSVYAGTALVIKGSQLVSNVANFEGGAIRSTSDVTIIDSTVSNNTATRDGGGLVFTGSKATANPQLIVDQLVIENSTFDSNAVDGSLTSFGGAIHAGALDFTNISIDNSTFTRNSARGWGGAIRLSTSGSDSAEFSAEWTLTDTLFANNYSGSDGGAIAVSGGPAEAFSIKDVTISNNNSGSRGGGISVNGPRQGGGEITLEDSVLTGNSANTRGGAIFASDGAVLYSSGIKIFSLNNTISGNSANEDGGGIALSSSSDDPNLSLIVSRNSTISGNSASNGGGVSSEGAKMNFKNTIVSGNVASRFGSEIARDVGALNATPNGQNLFGTSQITTNQALYNFVPDLADITATSDGLQPTALNSIIEILEDNGGGTLTHALVAGSPAIDAGVDANCRKTDQRGLPRVDGACDIGAYELVAPSLGFSVSATTAVEGEDDNVLFTITLDEPQDVAVGYDFATQAGTAIDGEDYVGRTGRVIFPAGVTVRERRVSILNDGVLGESDETFSLKVTDINNPAVNTVTEATIRETNALPVLTTTDVQVDEGLGQAVVEFTLSAASASEVSVRFETFSPQGANNPATDGDDYVGRVGKVVFQPGQTFKTRTVTIVDDNVVEADELFRIDLSDVVNVTLAPNNEQARIRILNDD